MDAERLLGVAVNSGGVVELHSRLVLCGADGMGKDATGVLGIGHLGILRGLSLTLHLLLLNASEAPQLFLAGQLLCAGYLGVRHQSWTNIVHHVSSRISTGLRRSEWIVGLTMRFAILASTVLFQKWQHGYKILGNGQPIFLRVVLQSPMGGLEGDDLLGLLKKGQKGGYLQMLINRITVDQRNYLHHHIALLLQGICTQTRCKDIAFAEIGIQPYLHPSFTVYSHHVFAWYEATFQCMQFLEASQSCVEDVQTFLERYLMNAAKSIGCMLQIDPGEHPTAAEAIFFGMLKVSCAKDAFLLLAPLEGPQVALVLFLSLQSKAVLLDSLIRQHVLEEFILAMTCLAPDGGGEGNLMPMLFCDEWELY